MDRSRRVKQVSVSTDDTSKRRQVLRFLTFFLIVLLFLAVSMAVVSNQFNNAGRDLYYFTADAVAFTADLFGSNTVCSGNKVSYDGFTIEVVGECTGLTEIIIFIAAVVAFPASVRQKIFGVVIGVSVILAANILRMMTLLWIGASSRYWFDVFHFYTYQASMLLLVIGTWMLWLNYAVLRKKERDNLVSH